MIRSGPSTTFTPKQVCGVGDWYSSVPNSEAFLTFKKSIDCAAQVLKRRCFTMKAERADLGGGTSSHPGPWGMFYLFILKKK